MKTKKTSRTLFVAALAALLCLALTGCGGKTKVEAAQYLSLHLNGCNGSATALVDFDNAAMEQNVMTKWGDKASWTKLGELTAVEMTMNVEPEKVENVSNGDKITVTVSVDEDAAKRAGYKFTDMKKTFTVDGLQDAVEPLPFG